MQIPDKHCSGPSDSGLLTPDSRVLHIARDDAGKRFAEIKAAYPPNAAREDWITAEHHARRLVEGGESWATLIAGVDRYATHVRATNRIVMNPANFFAAADKPWAQPWPIPENKAAPNPEALRAWQDVLDEKPRTPRMQHAVEAAGGWGAIRERTQFTSAKVQAAFCRAYSEGA